MSTFESKMLIYIFGHHSIIQITAQFLVRDMRIWPIKKLQNLIKCQLRKYIYSSSKRIHKVINDLVAFSILFQQN